MNEYIYAVRDKTTGKLADCKCHGGKFYTIKGFAERRCKDNNMEVVTFKLIEVKEGE